MTTNIAFARLQQYNTPGSMGLVTDTRYIRCFWPKFDTPTELFEKGSSGIVVMGPPTPRNIVFPPDTVFEEAHFDAFYPAEQAVMQLSPGRRGLVELNVQETAAWITAYDAAVAALPPTAAKQAVSDERFCVRYKVADVEQVADVSLVEAVDMASGKLTKETFALSKNIDLVGPVEVVNPVVVGEV